MVPAKRSNKKNTSTSQQQEGRLKAGSKRAANPVGRASGAKRAVWGHSASAKAVLVIPLSSDPPSLDEGDKVKR